MSEARRKVGRGLTYGECTISQVSVGDAVSDGCYYVGREVHVEDQHTRRKAHVGKELYRESVLGGVERHCNSRTGKGRRE